MYVYDEEEEECFVSMARPITVLARPHFPGDLVVSELLGSFADNELLPEITTPLVRDFLKQGSGVCIPASYETFVGPLEWPGLQQTVVDCSGNPAHGRGRLHSAHTATAAPQSEWLFRWSSLPSLYSWSAAVATEQTRTPMGGWTQFEMPRDGCIHAIGGWFTAHLYGDLHIDSRLTEHRNAFHWETFVLPLESPVEVRARDAVGITVERHTRVSEQPYIWQVRLFLNNNFVLETKHLVSIITVEFILQV